MVSMRDVDINRHHALQLSSLAIKTIKKNCRAKNSYERFPDDDDNTRSHANFLENESRALLVLPVVGESNEKWNENFIKTIQEEEQSTERYFE